MAEFMSLMLIRFGIIAATVVVLVIAGFTALMLLKRKGKLGAARRYVEPLAHRLADSPRRQARRKLGGRHGLDWQGAAARSLIDYLDENDQRKHR